MAKRRSERVIDGGGSLTTSRVPVIRLAAAERTDGIAAGGFAERRQKPPHLPSRAHSCVMRVHRLNTLTPGPSVMPATSLIAALPLAPDAERSRRILSARPKIARR